MERSFTVALAPGWSINRIVSLNGEMERSRILSGQIILAMIHAVGETERGSLLSFGVLSHYS